MADRNVIVRLKAEIADFKRGMDEAAKATEKIGSKGEESGRKATTALGRVAQSATQSREAWDTAGKSLAGYGVAVTGITAAVIKTGVSYNTLQQTSRAALTTLLGGAQAANAQMDKLDEFARTSPFSKSVFIDAQRQLIGFGMEAERVIPTLDAIQNAVAATGGSNQDIAELVRIIAQVGAAGKITATDLMQFGQRGVDAATLIGSQMGKTGAQIREEITAGTLDADVAIQALTDGMQERFGGAAAGVKNTFSGAVDRVRAAIRDLSSDWTAWLVDPTSATGGAAVTGLNKLADALRQFQKLPEPIKNTAGALFAVSGGAATAAGGIMLLLPRVIETRNAWKTLNADLNGTPAAIGRAAGVLAIVTVALAQVNAVLEEGGKRWAAWTSGYQNLGVDGVTAQILEGSEALRQYGAALAQSDHWSSTWRDRLEKLVPVLRLFGGDLDIAREQTQQFDAALAGLVEGGHADIAAQALKDAGISAEEAAEKLPQYAAALDRADNSQVLAAQSADDLSSAQQAAAASVSDAANAMELQSGHAKGLSGALLDLASATLEAHNANLAASNSAIGYQSALDKASESVKQNGKNLDITTEKGRANQQALNNVAAAALKVAEDNLTAGQSTAEVSAEMSKAREQFIQTAIRMGASSTEARRMADQFGLTTATVHNLSRAIGDVPAHKRTVLEAQTRDAIANVDALRRRIEGLSNRTITVGANVVLRGGQIGITADGGMYTTTKAGLIRAYAGGGMFDGSFRGAQPQIRAYQGPRGVLWGEEGSGPWEAFISGHPAKRDRSLRIWLDVGRRLGAIAAHADGAVQQYTRAARYAGPVAPTRPVGATGGSMRIEGVLDTPFGPSAVRGVVRSELDKVGRTISLSGGGY